MTKTGIFLIVVALALGATYLYLNTDLFVPSTIHIQALVRPTRVDPTTRFDDTSVAPVSFAFDKKFSLTEVMVVKANDAKVSKFPHAFWHLISDSNSVPVKSLVYGGMAPKGMKPKIPKARPEPLEPDVVYTLIVKADNYEGKIDFKTKESVKPAKP